MKRIKFGKRWNHLKSLYLTILQAIFVYCNTVICCMQQISHIGNFSQLLRVPQSGPNVYLYPERNLHKIVIIFRGPDPKLLNALLFLSQQKAFYFADNESYRCRCPCTVYHVKKEQNNYDKHFLYQWDLLFEILDGKNNRPKLCPHRSLRISFFINFGAFIGFLVIVGVRQGRKDNVRFM